MTALNAQQARQYSFTHYNSTNGLASNSVYQVTQDKQGFIWIATVNGLQRFDGKEFITLRHNRNEQASIPANNVASVFSDKDSRIWIINEDNSVGTINTGNFHYQPVPIQMPPKSEYFFLPSKFFEDWKGTLFLQISSIGIFELDPISFSFKPSNSIKIPPNWHLIDVAPDAYRECYWIGADSGLAFYHPATKSLNYRDHNTFGDGVIEAFRDKRFIGSIMPVRNSNDFTCSNWPKGYPKPYVYWYNARSDKIYTYDVGSAIGTNYSEVQGQFQQKNGQIWSYGLPFVGILQPQKPLLTPLSQLTTQNGLLRFDRANSMFEDRQQNLWLCTSDGIYVFNPDAQPFDSYYLLRPGSTVPKEGPVTSVIQLKNKQIWVGTWGMGLYCYDTQMNPLQIPAPFNSWKEKMLIWYIHEHSKSGKVFIAEQDGRLKIYDPSNGKAWFLQPEIFEHRTIRQIAEDKDGNLWFGTQGGLLIKWSLQKSGGDVTKGYELIAKPGLIYRLYTDTDGSLWIASLGKGVYHLDTKTGVILDQINSRNKNSWILGNDSPTDIIRYNDSLLVITGFSVTVLNTRRRTSEVISLDDGLPSNTAYYVKKDTRGRLWLGLQNGLCRWNMEKNSFTLFDRRDGIAYDNLTAGGAFTLDDNRMVFTTEHNFLVFDPLKVLNSDPPPPVTITNLHVMNKRLPVDSILKNGKLELDYKNNSVTIDYSSIQFLDHDQLTYFHKLEGLDKDWVRSTTNKAIYNFLPYRNFTFKVKCINGDGQSSERTTSLVIQARPPFWLSYWFMGFMVFLGVAFLYWLDKLRMQKIRATESIRTRIAGSLTDDLTNSLSSINISSELAKTKVDTDTGRTKDYIHQISETSNRMTQAMYDMVWSINPQNDQMHKTLDRMKHYAMEQDANFDMNITIDADPSIKEKESDMEHRYELLSIYKEAIANSVKHSGGKNIHVQLRLRKNKLLLLIQDDGKGFDLSKVALGRGLNDMKRRADAINAQLDILSEINTGTLIRLEMKLRY
jgi:signal transduction histidine kinase/ligand-binding sensor domain-containing protein